MTRRCPACNELFEPKRNWQVFCSESCRSSIWQKKPKAKFQPGLSGRGGECYVTGDLMTLGYWCFRAEHVSSPFDLIVLDNEMNPLKVEVRCAVFDEDGTTTFSHVHNGCDFFATWSVDTLEVGYLGVTELGKNFVAGLSEDRKKLIETRDRNRQSQVHENHPYEVNLLEIHSTDGESTPRFLNARRSRRPEIVTAAMLGRNRPEPPEPVV